MFSTSSLVLHYHDRTLNSLLPSRLLSLSYVVLHKAKPHSGIPGSERADSNANKGLTMRTPIGRFSSFPFSPLPPPTSTHQSSSPPDSTTFTISRSISSAADSSFPVKSIPSRRPYTSHSTMNLTALSSLRWLQKGLLSRIKIQKIRKNTTQKYKIWIAGFRKYNRLAWHLFCNLVLAFQNEHGVGSLAHFWIRFFLYFAFWNVWFVFFFLNFVFLKFLVRIFLYFVFLRNCVCIYLVFFW